ncbi:MAG TPA: hypothetical protein VLG74_04380 [Blastocatellia bacterium]|nr:hypothetical protein [Blastocatellia bacterium]
MLSKRTSRESIGVLVMVSASALFFGCAKPSPPKPMAEEAAISPAAEAASQPPQPAESPELPPPKFEDVQQAVKRVFKTAVVIDQVRNTAFLVGDYNGDLSQDLAAVLRPAEGKLSELNQEFPNWIAREPLKELLLAKSNALAHSVAARSSPNPASGQTIRFEQSDVLLAIIHGNGPKGWHDPEATQTHLMRDVVGTNMKTLPFTSALKAYKGVKPFPTIYGDLIEQTLIGQSGFVHFNGGVYGWYDPKNYSPGPVAVHSGMSAMK